MSILFQPYTLGSLELRNRFVRSATTSYWSDEQGIVRPEIIDLYRRLAEGGVGLIIKGHLYVKDSGKAHTGMAGISHDHHIPQLRKLTGAVHRSGGAIVAQLNYGGINSVVDRAGPSDYVGEGWTARALSSDEASTIIEAFGDAAERALMAGFDGVQIHGAHGYLISQFLSRHVNTRTDAWGGSLENRMRLLLEVYDAIRARIGRRPLLLKLNCDDFSEDGFRIEDSIKVAQTICRRGLDVIEISGGGMGRQSDLSSRALSTDPALAEAAFAGYATQLRAMTKPTPLALVNNIREQSCMEALIKKDVADLISMSRPFIKEPDLVIRLQAGQPASTCPSCSACISSKVFGKMMLRCHLDST